MTFQAWMFAWLRQTIEDTNPKSEARARFERTLHLAENFEKAGPYPLRPERLHAEALKGLSREDALAALEDDSRKQREYYDACEAWVVRANE